MGSVKIAGVKPPGPGLAIRVMVEGAPVAVFAVDGELHGLDARCTHVGGPLDRGSLHGATVTCPLHGSQFDVRTGEVRRGPAMRPAKTYRVRAEPDGLTVEWA
jgi:3-phenylpropionate/trans-cinnamate dioxygenase ferredoxin component